MLIKPYIQDNIVTPECCYIPEWSISLSCQDKNTVSMTFYNDNLYCVFDGIHDVEHRKNENLEDYLDLRIWTDKKIIAVWIKDKRFAHILLRIEHKLRDGDYKVNNGYEPISINLAEYDIVFLSKEEDHLNIIKCPLYEFYENEDMNIQSNTYERQYHILTPMQKEQMKKSGRFRKKLNSYYSEGDKAWKDKIGDMDIAQYHLLIYGE